jgi:hypothetical protein
MFLDMGTLFRPSGNLCSLQECPVASLNMECWEELLLADDKFLDGRRVLSTDPTVLRVQFTAVGFPLHAGVYSMCRVSGS